MPEPERAGSPQRGGIGVEVVFAHAGRVHAQSLTLPPGARVGDALEAARQVHAAVQALAPALLRDPGAIAVHGQAATLGRLLEHGDRVEIVGPLRIDPMASRRRRAAGG